jgi:predicted nucleic acid-binding protein
MSFVDTLVLGRAVFVRDAHHGDARDLWRARAGPLLKTSFAIMRRRRITDALAYDGDFSAADRRSPYVSIGW